MTKRILWSLLGLALLALVALEVFLHSPLLERTVMKYASPYVDGTLEVGDVGIRLKGTTLKLTVDELKVTYPHDRFEGLASAGDEGRSESGDTLIDVPRISLGIALGPFLGGRRLRVTEAEMDSLRVFVHFYDSLTSNLDVFVVPVSEDEAEADSSSAFLKRISLGHFGMIGPHIVYADQPGGLKATLDLSRFEASGEYDMEANSVSDVSLTADGVQAGRLIASAGDSFGDAMSLLHCDAVASIQLSAPDPVCLDSLHGLPPFDICMQVPTFTLSVDGFPKPVSFAFNAQCVSGVDGSVDVALADVALDAEGVSLSSTAAVEDLLGRDPLYRIDACLLADLEKALMLTPDCVRDSVVARGRLDFDISGSILNSQLSVFSCCSADIRASLVGTELMAASVDSSFVCYADKPDFRLTTSRSLIDGGGRAMNLKGSVDSLDFSAGRSVMAKGKKISLFAQNSSNSIVDSLPWHPFAGRFAAERLSVRSTDSMFVAIRGTDNDFTVTPREIRGRIVPGLRLLSENEKILFKSPNMAMASRDASIVASARMRALPDSSQMLRMRRFYADSSVARPVPDYLSESDFALSDIDIDMGESIGNLFRRWSPSLDLNIGRTLLFTSSFPLRNELSDVHGRYDDDKLSLDSLKLLSGKSDMTASVEVSGIRRTLLHRGGAVKISADFSSDTLDLDEILSAISHGSSDAALSLDEEVSEEVLSDQIHDTSSAASALIVIPSNINADVHFNASKMRYYGVVLNDVHSDLDMRERCVRVSNSRASTDMGSLNFDAFYSTKTKKDISAGFSLDLSNVTADRVISFLPQIDTIIPLLKSFEGNLNCQVAATGQLDTAMNFILPTLNGMFKIGGSDLLLGDIGSLRKVTRLLRFRDKKEGHIDDMSVNGVISDNVFEVFPFILSVDRYVVALKGVQEFGDQFDYHLSLIKSPLPFKLGIDIYGKSLDKWRFRLGRPQFKSTNVPVFSQQVDDMQLNLITSIRDVFSRGVDAVLKSGMDAQAALQEEKRRAQYSPRATSEPLSFEEQRQIDQLMIEQEIEDEAEALSKEIDELLKNM